MSDIPNKKILLLTLVHPDFLPPVYSVAQVLRDASYDIHILTFDSFTPSHLDIGGNIVVESIGQHHNIGLLQRLKLRNRFKKRAATLLEEKPYAIIAFCPFSFLSALKIKKNTPVIYIALEVADFIWSFFLKSPLSGLNSFVTLRKIKDADLVATPSIQRSAWLAGRCHADFMPYTIFNTAYLNEKNQENDLDTFKAIVPRNLSGKKIVLYTGAVNDHLCIMELVTAFDHVNDQNSLLIITGIKDNQYCNQLKEFVKNSSSSGSIILLPFLTRAQMLSLQSNADIGVCLAKEYDNNLESKMMAPNKVGEYLAKGLYILSIRNEYMLPFEMKGIAALSPSTDPTDISVALKNALQAVNEKNYKIIIRTFVKEYFCMQQQLKPVIRFLGTLTK